jgi:hypothetical protein
MNVRRLVIPLALAIVLALTVATVVALAQAGRSATPAKPCCGMQAGAGCGTGAGGAGMGMGRGCGMRRSGGCGMGMAGGCGMMGAGRGRMPAKTRALASGQVALAATPRGLLVLVADESHQSDPNASVSATGSGAGKHVGLKVTKLGAGRFALTGDLTGVSEIAVRVTKGTTSELVYFGAPTLKAGACAGCGTACQCGAGCTCASGDKSACQCGDACKCAACGKAGAAAKCGVGCKCPRCSGQK